jgi:hypothetical protein
MADAFIARAEASFAEVRTILVATAGNNPEPNSRFRICDSRHRLAAFCTSNDPNDRRRYHSVPVNSGVK